MLVASFGNFPAAHLLQFQSDEKADPDMKAMFAR